MKRILYSFRPQDRSGKIRWLLEELSLSYEVVSLDDENDERIHDYSVMIILNRPSNLDIFLLFKTKSDYIICCDGAANQVYDQFELKNEK